MFDSELEPNAPDRVRQIAVPADALALSTLSHVDYADAFLIEVGAVTDRTAEQWARAIMDEAPAAVRNGLRRGWTMLGLKLDKRPPGASVIGWPVLRSDPDVVLLGADSRIGMRGQLLFRREPKALLFATFVQQDNLIARAVWAMTEPTHVRVVRDIMAQASLRLHAAADQ